MAADAVVIVTDSLHVDGGSSKVALSSAVALAEAGRRVIVFSAFGSPDATLASTPGLTTVCTGQEHIAARGARAALSGIWNARAGTMMRDCLATLDPERTVVHVHGWTKALSASVIHAALQAKFRVVITLHEYFTACPTGSLFLHDRGTVCTIAPMSAACIAHDCDSRSYAHKLWRVARQLVQSNIARIPAGISDYIVVSEFSRDIIAPMLPPKSVYRHVHNPVDAVAGERVAAERNAPFAYVGRLSPEKGPVLFAAAAKRAGVPALFIGDGEERDAVLAANPEAVVTGWLSPAETIARLRAARALVLPSLWYETLGLTVLEAAALGVPAIVPERSAARDSVRDGETGLYFTSGNEADLVAQLTALTDDAVVARLSQNAYAAYWAAPFTMERHVTGLLAAYEAALAERSSERVAARHDLAASGAA